MSTGTALQPSFEWEKVEAHRSKKRTKIYEFFEANLGKRFSSPWLHETFGVSFRTRASEINRDETSEVRICNEYKYVLSAGKEVSYYWSETR